MVNIQQTLTLLSAFVPIFKELGATENIEKALTQLFKFINADLSLYNHSYREKFN